jgi:Uma2 family endonuclease
VSVVLEKPKKRNGTAPTRRWFTVADLAALPDELPSGPVKWELWDGEIRLMPPPGDFHGSIAARITTALSVYGEWEGHGRTTGGDVGVVLQDVEPQTCLGADVAFIAKDQLPAQHSKEGYLLTPPAIVAEVRSKNDTSREVQEKVQRYLARGARLVWDVNPKKETVTVHRPGHEPQILRPGDELTAEGIIPNLKFPVRRLFEDLDEGRSDG